MKLYIDPITTTSRPVLMFVEEHKKLQIDVERVDVLAGGHLGAAYLAISPAGLVPALVDDDLALGESAAILRYLADCCGSAAYPAALKQRARVNAAMDFINTQISRDLGYHYCYPSLFPPLAYRSAAAQAEVSERGLAGATRWLAVLDQHMLGTAPFLCGESISLADYLAIGPFSVAEAAGFDLSPWPHLHDWYARMKSRPSWAPTHAAFDGLIAAIKRSRQAA